MIKELWQYVSTSTELPVAKEMGFLKEAIEMEARASRCQQSWSAHYQNCQKAIISAANRSLQKRTVLVLGAGSLNDVPLGVLSKQFEKVILVDLVFLKSARRLAAQFGNIDLVEHDITESLKWIVNGQPLVQAPDAWLNNDEIDLVVSLNLITQLPLIPARWLINEFDLPEVDADVIGKQLIFAHLHYLRMFHGEVCLIADRTGIEFDAQGNETDRFDPWWDVEPPKPEQSWEWGIIPLGEERRNMGQKNLVAVSML
ncbi:MAG: hypothetical protein ISEC1_P1050 [Thiomicrorhabdus sp.]|nr:MAG: hypothetical protein ISEC1_P1050 [Thiomicrorhabdus sp.]